MFGRKPYKQGDDTLKNVLNYFKSPHAAQMFGNMSAGQNFGEAKANADLFTRDNEYREHQRQMQEHMMGLNNEYKRAQINRMNAPGPSPTTWQAYKDQQGNTIGQVNTLGKVELFPKNAEKKQGPLKAADGFYYNNDGTRTFPDVVKQPPDLSPAQSAANKEIEDARNMITNITVPPGSTLSAEVQRRTQSQTNTGRDNPDYDPLLTRALNRATNRMVGDDIDYTEFMQNFRQPQSPPPNDNTEMLKQARDAISKGADPKAVTERLRSMGIENPQL